MKMNFSWNFRKIFNSTSVAIILVIVGCGPVSEDILSSSAASTYLYVAAGACYSGGNTTFTNLTASNIVYRINTVNGIRDAVIADYNQSPAQVGDTPVGVVAKDLTYLYVLVENTTSVGSRRIERVERRASGSRSMFSNNITALSAQLRGISTLSSGDILLSKSTAIEKLSSANVRITAGANPYVNAPGGTCITSTTLISKVLTLGNGNIVFLHAAAAQNRIGIISAAGYTAAADCKTSQAAPTATAFPVAAAYDATNTTLIVAYAGNTLATDVNSIYAYSVNETTNVISNPQKIYDASLYPVTYPYLLYGISEMTYDSVNRSLYIATAISTVTTVVNYAIEKFTYDFSKIGVSNTTVLTRVGSTPFYPYGIDTKCITSMFVGY
ncbi:MAG: hypothetical protein V4736_13790 [Bdellovibrionota bacterium]